MPDGLSIFDDDDDELEVASALRMFLRRPPTGADHAVVTASTPQGDQVVRDCSIVLVRTDASGVATDCADACDRWARAEGREVRFRVQWLDGERVLGTHQWRVGEGDPQALDGTVESFLTQQQRHAETQHRLYHDGYEMVQEGWRTLLKAANERIKSLEADNAELRDRLRKVDDVSSEIALASAQADLDARGRTADILEQRLLPMAQALLLQQAQRPPSAASPGRRRRPCPCGRGSSGWRSRRRHRWRQAGPCRCRRTARSWFG